MKSRQSLALLSYCWNYNDIRLFIHKSLTMTASQQAAPKENELPYSGKSRFPLRLHRHIKGDLKEDAVAAQKGMNLVGHESKTVSVNAKSSNAAKTLRFRLQALAQAECHNLVVRVSSPANTTSEAFEEEDKTGSSSGSSLRMGTFNNLPSIYDDEDDDHPLMIDLSLYQQHPQDRQTTPKDVANLRRIHSANSLRDCNRSLASTSGRSEGE
jgi:hypothetical protein